jgi:hypothetical protein
MCFMTIFHLIKWILKMILRFIKVFLKFISVDAFETMNFANAILSIYLIVLWIKILLLSFTEFDSNGYSKQ